MKYPDLRLGRIEAFMNKVGGMEGLDIFLSNPHQGRPMQFVDTIAVEAHDRFIVRDFLHSYDFVKNQLDGVRITWIDDSVWSYFSDLVEETNPIAGLRIHRPLRKSDDMSIVNFLGNKAYIKFGQVRQLLRRQGQGEPGPLLTDNTSNRFYILNGGKICRLGIAWMRGENGWGMVAHEADNEERIQDCQVISG